MLNSEWSSTLPLPSKIINILQFFSFTIFMISCFTFKSPSHLDFILKAAMTWSSNLIFFLIVSQLYPPCFPCGSFQKAAQPTELHKSLEVKNRKDGTVTHLDPNLCSIAAHSGTLAELTSPQGKSSHQFKAGRAEAVRGGVTENPPEEVNSCCVLATGHGLMGNSCSAL